MVIPVQSGKYAVAEKPAALHAGKFSLPLGKRTYMMGILNVTPDSFADGGLYISVDQALRHVSDMLAYGADIIDIGGESTRPGCEPVGADDEINRVLPVLEIISQTFNCPISIDTAKAEVAEAALKAGACIVNDINGLQKDPDMAGVACRHHAAVVMMHNARLYRQHDGEDEPSASLVSDIIEFLERSIQIALKAGLCPENMIVDPGVGFGVTYMESVQMIAELAALKKLNLPILLGPSRKRFIGHILGLPIGERLHGTGAAVAIGISNGADIVRVHDVREMTEIARVSDALCRGVGI